MAQRIYHVPEAENEYVYNYAPGSSERNDLKKALKEAKAKVADIPMYIGGEEVRTGNMVEIRPPHELNHLLGHYHQGDETHVQMAIDAALKAKENWAAMPWKDRASVFLRAAALISGPYRAKLNAASMLGQSKTAYQSEIDAAAETCDFFRYNVQYMTEIYTHQPKSASNTWNRLEQRPLEGFVFALSPFNFTSIAANLAAAPALMGNVIVWKPSNTQVYSAQVLMEIYKEAGLPDGVINLVYVSGPTAGDVIFSHRDFAGIHFTGSTGVFQNIWRTIGENIKTYKTYPRIVGETGGKDFVMVHKSAKPSQVSTALSRGAFEYQGQKCSAASRAYIPNSLWPEIKDLVLKQLSEFKMGSPEDFRNFITAVIDEKSFNNLTAYINMAKKDSDTEIIAGGNYDKSKGYFIEPTIILTKNPCYVTMIEELFGPVLTIYIYEDDEFEPTLDLVDRTSIYALTGAIFATEREAVQLATKKLINAAGNFYINDKPTGAVVGHQPFGGARGSGTNDKAGSLLNLQRWVSPRTIKECFLPPEDFKYPFLEDEISMY